MRRTIRRTNPTRLAAMRAAWAGILALGLLAAPGCGAPAGSDDSDATIAPAELAGRIAQGTAPPILDVRSPGEYRDGHLPGAVNIPYDELAGRMDEVPAAPDEEIVVHCHGGKRAAVAEDVLREAGYTHVRDLEGHWKGWSAADLPTE